MAVRSDWKPDAGSEVQVDLPGTGAAVIARAVRWRDGALALAFRQDEATLQRLDQALERIAATKARAAA
jgi:hypothetical protein